MASRIIAIGDIHGCAAALKTLLDEIDPGSKDTLITLGDYVDRGPDSRGVIEQMIDLQQKCRVVPLLGNHEVMMLAARDSTSELGYWLQCGGQQTVDSYGGNFDNVPDEHFEFIQNCRWYYETAEHIFLHANYIADMELKDQPEYAVFWEHITHMPPGPHCSGKTAIVGHTPQSSGDILDLDHVICIDTCCFGPGYLTAFDVETYDIWQADKAGQLRTD